MGECGIDEGCSPPDTQDGDERKDHIVSSVPKEAWLTIALAVLLTVLGFLIYSNVLSNGIFIFDDFEYVVGNPLIENPSVFKDMTDPRQVGYLSFALNFALSGDSDAFGYHLVNILIHIANALLVYLLLRLVLRVLGPEAAEAAPRTMSWEDVLPALVSLVFLVHPIETQAVSYVTQRFTSLSAFFYLAAILSYLSFRVRLERHAHGLPVYVLFFLSMASTVLGMKTKEISFTIPFMMAVFELLIFDRSVFSKRRFYFLIPFMATLIIIPLSLFGPEWGITGPGRGVDEVTRRDKLFDLLQRSPYEYLVTQFRVIVTYLRLMIFPVNQMVVYDFKASKSFFEPKVILSFLFLLSIAGAAAYAWWRARRAASRDKVFLRLFVLGVFWFFITLSIESSVIPIKDVIFEHRVYLPSIGFFAALSVLLVRAADRLLPAAGMRVRAAALTAVIVIPLSVATYLRNEIWTDEVLFWDDVVQKTGKAIGYNNRGNAYLKLQKYDLALRDLDKTISFFPSATDRMAWENADFTPTNMAKTYMSRGNVYASLGDVQHAQEDFAMAKTLMLPAPPMMQKRVGIR